VDISKILPNVTQASDSSKVEGLERQSKRASDAAKIKKLASEFESVFMEQMLKSMRQSVQKGGLIDGGNAEEIYQSMLDGEYSKSMSLGGKNSISGMIELQLLEGLTGSRAEAQKIVDQTSGLASYKSTAKVR
jgi:Rod binding domain-containing protein